MGFFLLLLLFPLVVADVVGPAFVRTLVPPSDALPYLSSPTDVAVYNSSIIAVTASVQNMVGFYSFSLESSPFYSATPLFSVGIPPTTPSTFGGGFVDGPQNTAQFREPQGLCASEALDSVFILDQGGEVIRRIQISTRQTTTIAGNLTRPINSSPSPPPYSGMDALAAHFGSLSDCVVVNSTLFAVDAEFNCVIEISLVSFQARTISGYFPAPMTQGTGFVDGGRDVALYTLPLGIDFDEYRRGLWIADSGNSVIRFLSLNGDSSSSHIDNSGWMSDIKFSSSYYNMNNNLNINFNYLFLSTVAGNHSTRGTPSTLTENQGFGLSFFFGNPVDVVFLPQSGGNSQILAVLDETANRIWGMNISEGFIAAIAGLPSIVGGDIDGPLGVNEIRNPICGSFFHATGQVKTKNNNNNNNNNNGNADGDAIDSSSNVVMESIEGVIFVSQGMGLGNGAVRLLNTEALEVYSPPPPLVYVPLPDTGHFPVVLVATTAALGGTLVIAIVALVIVLRVNVQLRTRLMTAIIARARSREIRRKAKKAGVPLDDFSFNQSTELSSSSLSSLQTVQDRRIHSSKYTTSPIADHSPQTTEGGGTGGTKEQSPRPMYPLRDSARIRFEAPSYISAAQTIEEGRELRAPAAEAMPMPGRSESNANVGSVVGSLPFFMRYGKNRPRDSDGTTSSRTSFTSMSGTTSEGGLHRERSNLSVDVDTSSTGHEV